MIVTRRKFLVGATAVAATTGLIAKAGLPKLLPAPGRDPALATWQLGLLHSDARELQYASYKRAALLARWEQYEPPSQEAMVLYCRGQGAQVVWFAYETWHDIAYWAVWPPGGVGRPIYKSDSGFGGAPMTLTYGNQISLHFTNNAVLRMS